MGALVLKSDWPSRAERMDQTDLLFSTATLQHHSFDRTQTKTMIGLTDW